MVLDSEKDHPSRWAAVTSIAGKFDCSAYTLLENWKPAVATDRTCTQGARRLQVMRHRIRVSKVGRNHTRAMPVGVA